MMNRYVIIALAALMSTVTFGQTLQIKFCGKTSNVTPRTDPAGNDQRHKGGIRLDFIRVGLNANSRSNPFYQLGINGAAFSFKNDVQVDGCNANGNATMCTGCTTCKNVLDINNTVIAAPSGRMVDDVRIRTLNNDLYIESTGRNNVVCIETTPINVRDHAGKRLEVNFGYEGTERDGFSTQNVHAEYRYNNGNWINTLNQNSGFLRYIDTAIFIINPVPAVLNLDHIVQFRILPNPLQNELFVEFEANEALDVKIEIIDALSKVVMCQPWTIRPGNGTEVLDVSQLHSGFYILQIVDKLNRVSHKKFVKKD